MLQTVGWRPMAYRRADAKLCMVYTIVNGLVKTRDAITTYILFLQNYSTVELSSSIHWYCKQTGCF